MSDATGISRTQLPNGMEFAYIDKGVGKPMGIPRDQYDAKGYQPPYDSLPTK